MGYQIELRHLRYFLAVAKDLHFRKAAERLFISQPGLSRQIKEMEEGLGIQLFERHNRKVELTKAGTFLQGAMEQQLKNLDQTIQHAQLLHSGLPGRLRLGYVGSAMQNIIPNCLLAFRKQHPEVLFNLTEMDNQAQIDGLLNQDIDIGFVRLEKVPPGLVSRPVLREHFCLVLPKDHPVDASNFRSLAQVSEEPFILFDPKTSPAYYEKVMQIFNDSGFEPIVAHNTIHSSSIYKLVENHFGISIVPKSLQIEHLAAVKFIDLEAIRQRTVLSVVWREESWSPVVADFLELV